MRKRWRFGIGLALVLVAVSLALWRVWLVAPDYDGTALSVAEAHDGAQDGEILLIDIRRPDEWQKTGVPRGPFPSTCAATIL